MTELPIFYSFRRCPYAMRARLALLVSGVAVEIREVALGNKPLEMIAASPKATVPVIVLPTGQVIDESLHIMRWALERSDPECWLDGDAPELIAANDGPFKYHLDRYKYPHRYDDDPLPHRAAGLALLDVLEVHLRAHNHLCGTARSLADMALMPFVRQFAMTDMAWFDAQALPKTKQWLSSLLASALFDEAMVRLTPWKVGDKAVWFQGHDKGSRVSPTT